MKKLIICGSYRSGTTALATILNKHSEIICLNEAGIFNNEWKERIGNLRNAYTIWKKRKRIWQSFGLKRIPYDLEADFKFNHNLGETLEEILGDELDVLLTNIDKITYEELIKLLISRKNAKYIGDKLPEYVFLLPRIVNINTKIICCIRDPRDVITSQIRNYWDRISTGFNITHHHWCRPDVKSCIEKYPNWYDYMKMWIDVRKRLPSYYEFNYTRAANEKSTVFSELAEYLEVNKREMLELSENWKPYNHMEWKRHFEDLQIPDSWKELMKKLNLN